MKVYRGEGFRIEGKKEGLACRDLLYISTLTKNIKFVQLLSKKADFVVSYSCKKFITLSDILI